MNARDVHGNAAVDAAIDEAMNQNTGGPIMIHLLSPSEIDALRSRWTPRDPYGWIGGTSPEPDPLPPWVEPTVPVLDRKVG
jgi:hypothetical protein